jgi:carboxylesterase type B
MPSAEAFFQLFIKAADCASVNCLETKSTAQLAAAAATAWANRTGQPDYAGENNYAPVVDGVELTATPLQLTLAGHTFSGPVLLGTAADEVCSLEGKDFPFDFSEADFKADTAAEYGGNGVNVSTVTSIYAGQPNASCGCSTPQMPEFCIKCKKREEYSPWWWAAMERGSDFGFHCPSRTFSKVFGATNPTYLYTFKVLKEQFPGLWCVPHCSELSSVFFNTAAIDPNTPQGKLLLATALYRISFIRHGDPNIDRHASAPKWLPYEAVSGSNSMALSMEDAGGIHLEQGYRKM